MAFGDEQIDGYAEGEEPVIFHYKKGDFRKREAKVYSDLATGQNQPGKGFFRVLVNTKGNRFMFFTLVIVFVMVLMIGLFSGKTYEASLDGLNCSLDAFSYEGSIYSSVELSEKSKSAKKNSKGAAEIGESDKVFFCDCKAVFYFYNSDGDEADRREVSYTFDSGKVEGNFIRASVTDFDLVRVECEISNGMNTIRLKQNIKKR